MFHALELLAANIFTGENFPSRFATFNWSFCPATGTRLLGANDAWWTRTRMTIQFAFMRALAIFTILPS